MSLESCVRQADLIYHTELSFKGKPWENVSDSLKQLIKGMLEKDPQERLTIADVLEHPWFNKPTIERNNRQLD